jgi:hypothetical protein
MPAPVSSLRRTDGQFDATGATLLWNGSRLAERWPVDDEGGTAMAKKSEREVKQELQQRLEEIAYLKEQAQRQGLAFASRSEEELEKRIRGETSATPYIYGAGWVSGTSIGSSASYGVYVANPDPTAYGPVFLTIFFGLGNFFNDVGEAADARDERWPYASSSATYLQANGTMNATIIYTTPSTVPAGTYLGNAIVWEASYLDKGRYFDRGFFDVTLF